MRPWSGRRALFTLCYVAVAVVLIGCLVPFWADLLPLRLAHKVTDNSEGYTIALLLVPWILSARPRLAGRRAEWPVALVSGAVLIAIGVALILTDLPSRFRTLNEAFIAAGLLIPYIQARRPLPRGVAVAVAVIGFLIAAVFSGVSAQVTDLAEVWGAMVLIPLGLDVFDRGILDPAARTSGGLRWGWYAFLVVAPAAVAVSWSRVGGIVHDVLRYTSRCNEDFIAALCISLLLAVVLGRTGNRRPGAEAPADAGISATVRH